MFWFDGNNRSRDESAYIVGLPELFYGLRVLEGIADSISQAVISTWTILCNCLMEYFIF